LIIVGKKTNNLVSHPEFPDGNNLIATSFTERVERNTMPEMALYFRGAAEKYFILDKNSCLEKSGRGKLNI
jgi:hypothetical protein